MRWLGLCALLVSCTQPRTQVMVIVTGDSQIVTDARRLHFIRSGGANRTALGAVDEDDLIVTPASWPVLVPIVPLGNDASRVFRIEARAIDEAGAEIVRSVALGSFVPGTTKALTMRLETACRGISCADEQTTCRGGVCRDAFIDVSMLPDYVPPSATDAGDTGPMRCGDGIVQAPEVCDDAEQNGMGYAPGFACMNDLDCPNGRKCDGRICAGFCNVTCTAFGPSCGDGVEQPEFGEQCDVPGLPTASCTELCMPRMPGCGDGFVVNGELCYTDQPVPIGAEGYSATAAADFDGDDLADIAFGGLNGDIVIMKGRGDGTFIENFAIASGAGTEVFGLETVDLENDGRSELATANWSGFCTQPQGCLVILIVNTDGTIAPWQLEPFPSLLTAAGGGDFEPADGIPEAVVTQFSPTGADQPATVFGLDAGNVFRRTWEGRLPLSQSGDPMDFATALHIGPSSVTASGHALWVGRRFGGLEIYEIDGSGGIVGLVQGFPFDADRLAGVFLTRGEIDGDGEADILYSYLPTTTLQPTTWWADRGNNIGWPLGGNRLEGVHITDADQDGMGDVVLATDVAFGIARNDATNLVPSGWAFSVCADIRDTAVADFDGDTYPDIAFATSCGGYVVLANP